MSKILYRTAKMSPRTYVRGENIYLFDSDNNKIIDSCSNSMNVNLGYTQPKIIKAIDEQAKKLPYMHNSKGTTFVQEILAEKLTSLLPEGNYKAYFCSNGSDAIEAAMRISYLYQKEKNNKTKCKFITYDGSYHGSTLGALSVTGNKFVYSNFTNLINNYKRIEYPLCSECSNRLVDGQCNIECINKLENESFRDVAAIVFDSMITNPLGCRMAPRNYLKRLEEICKKNDVLLIIDEIATSIGRTGKNFAFQHGGITPDIICLSKGLGVGYTNIGAVLVNENVYSVLRENSNILGHTYNGNPIACAVGITVLDIIEKQGIKEHVVSMEKILIENLSKLAKLKSVKDIRGKGLMYAIEFDHINYGKDFVNKVNTKCLELGVLTLCVNSLTTGHITLAPPLIINEEQIEELILLIYKAILLCEKEYKVNNHI